MKLIAVAMRGKRRDFVDVFFLLKKYRLDELISFCNIKYPNFETLAILKGLSYFKDAEKEDVDRGIKIFDENFNWETAKKEIVKNVEEYQIKALQK